MLHQLLIVVVRIPDVRQKRAFNFILRFLNSLSLLSLSDLPTVSTDVNEKKRRPEGERKREE